MYFTPLSFLLLVLAFNIQSITRKSVFFLIAIVGNLNSCFYVDQKLISNQSNYELNKLSSSSFQVNLFIYPFFLLSQIDIKAHEFPRDQRGNILFDASLAFPVAFLWLVREKCTTNQTTLVANVYWIFFLVEIVCKYESDRKTNRGL